MNKNIEWILVLAGSMFMLWFSFSVLFFGRELYGTDASLLWASGMLSWIGIRGVSYFIIFLKSKSTSSTNKEQEGKK